MVKISMFKKENGSLLVVKRSTSGYLVGEVYTQGVEKRGKWDMKATFFGKEATEYRVCEYFNFDVSKPYWRRWA